MNNAQTKTLGKKYKKNSWLTFLDDFKIILLMNH